MDDFNEEKEQDVIDILYEYDEDRGNLISKTTREKLKNYYKKEEEGSEKICKIVFESIEDDNIKEKCKEMLEDFKGLIKDEIGFLNYIYYRQGFKMGANVIKDCLINND